MKSTSATMIRSPKQRAVEALRGYIKSSGLKEGTRLPAESRLANEFAVSRMTLRSALGVLEQEGLVRRERNLGCVCTAPSASKRGLMARTIVLLSNHEPATDGRLYAGTSASVVSGVIDRVNQEKMNFLRLYPEWDRDAWLDELAAENPAGVVVSCWHIPHQLQHNVLSRLSAAGIPLVTFGEHPSLANFDRVCSDHVGGTRQLVQLLASHGKKRILRLWTMPADTTWIQAHNQGYEQEAAALGLEAIPAVYIDDFGSREPRTLANFTRRVRQMAGNLVEHLHSARPIDAIIVSTDHEALVALAACRLFGREDVVVTGYDNNWQDATERQWEPGRPFATIDKHNHRLGEEMVDLLLQRIEQKLPPTPQVRVIEQQVVVPT